MSQFVLGCCIVCGLMATDDGFLLDFLLCRLFDLKVEMGMNSLIDFGWCMVFHYEMIGLHSLLDFGWCIVFH